MKIQQDHGKTEAVYMCGPVWQNQKTSILQKEKLPFCSQADNIASFLSESKDSLNVSPGSARQTITSLRM